MRPPRVALFAVVLTVALFGGLSVVGADSPDEARSPAVTDRPVPVENDSTYWRGQTLAFSVENANTYEVRTADDGTLVAQLAASNGSATLDTTGLSPGRYVLRRDGTAPVAYQFAVARQSLSATESDGAVAVQSNRASFSVAVESPDLSADQLRSLFPDAVERNGTIALAEVGGDVEVATNASAVPEGEYEIRLRALDTGANATVSLSVSADARTTTGRTATETTTGRTATETTTDRSSTGTTDAGGTATTETTSSPTGVPGFGVPTAILVLALALGTAAGRTE